MMSLKNIVGGKTVQAESRTEERNYGIDLLRIVAMYMIVAVHILVKGGVLGNEIASSAYVLDNFLYSIVLCGVNCFALVSGFVGYREDDFRHHFSSYIYLWMQVVFSGVVVSTVIKCLGINDVGIKNFLEAILPVTRDQYWYFTAYTGVFMVAPYLKRVVSSLDENSSRKCCILMGSVFSLYATVAQNIGGDLFGLNEGYSFIWLVMLYFIGAIIKKNAWHKRVRNSWLLYIFVGCIVFTVAWRFGCGYLTQKVLDFPWGERMFMSYVSPTIVIMSICLLMLFSNMRISERGCKIIASLSPSVFGIYIIHEQPLIRQLFFKNKFNWLANLPGIMPAAAIIGIAGGVFAVCIVIDRIRYSLFEFLHMKELLRKGEQFIQEKLHL